LPGPRGPGEEEDCEFLLLGLLIALRRHILDPDPTVQRLCVQWAAEAAALQEVLRGWNDPG